jgi:hypothetical protein
LTSTQTVALRANPFANLMPVIEDLTLLPWCQARRVLGDRPLRFRVLSPPYAALGVGTLRALRVAALTGEHDGAWELLAGYDGYERI